MSAYGLQSLPKMESVQKDTSDFKDLDFEAEFLTERQHLKDGYAIMKKLTEYQIAVPVDDDDREKSSRGFSYYSQVSNTAHSSLGLG